MQIAAGREGGGWEKGREAKGGSGAEGTGRNEQAAGGG